MVTEEIAGEALQLLRREEMQKTERLNITEHQVHHMPVEKVPIMVLAVAAVQKVQPEHTAVVAAPVDMVQVEDNEEALLQADQQQALRQYTAHHQTAWY